MNIMEDLGFENSVAWAGQVKFRTAVANASGMEVNSLALQGDDRIVVRGDGFDIPLQERREENLGIPIVSASSPWSRRNMSMLPTDGRVRARDLNPRPLRRQASLRALWTS
ncbi:hypothetical protein SADUNF_Sadunf16G0006200 [Salix dunnii]|uniref:Uncharacterized protein n=1 Tax=Salix dunnii TaxID=1413687 RepID=A0A835J6G7_9ROSI|nr:hypothetical protein SADUNF_Sadunf16G0006200 [Salix dunnii]